MSFRVYVTAREYISFPMTMVHPVYTEQFDPTCSGHYPRDHHYGHMHTLACTHPCTHKHAYTCVATVHMRKDDGKIDLCFQLFTLFLQLPYVGITAGNVSLHDQVNDNIQ